MIVVESTKTVVVPNSGRVTFQNWRHAPAPSTVAAS